MQITFYSMYNSFGLSFIPPLSFFPFLFYARNKTNNQCQSTTFRCCCCMEYPRCGWHTHTHFILHLFVVIVRPSVPPNIDDSLSSSDVIVREGSNVSLRCRSSGSPTPTVKWKRDSMEKISINKSLVGKFVSFFLFLFAHVVLVVLVLLFFDENKQNL